MSGGRYQFRFPASEADLEKTQRELLASAILAPNSESSYGVEYGFSDVLSAEAYRERVPLVTYEDLRPWVDRIVAGDTNVLTSERVLAFFKTSGTLSLPKLIPVTTSLMSQKVASFAAFWERVYEDHPSVRDGKMVSNFTDSSGTEPTPSGIDIYSESGFWSRRGRSLHSLDRWPLPAEVRSIEDARARTYATARLLLQSELHCIMCLNPSTLLQFCRTIQTEHQSLIKGLRDGSWGTEDTGLLELLGQAGDGSLETRLVANAPAAQRLQSVTGTGEPFRLVDVWPSLAVVICWCSRVVQPYFSNLRGYLEGVAVRDYITQSSECMMAIPLDDGGSGGALAYTVHFFEFVPEEQVDMPDPDTRFAWELEEGKRYEQVVTTGGGLYRYRMGDCVLVTGLRGGLPTLEFLYRIGRTSSMTGEKLTEFQVLHAGAEATRQWGTGPEEYLCYPCSGEVPHYAVLLDAGSGSLSTDSLSGWATAFESELCAANGEYADKCDSGRLGRIRAYEVPGGALRARRQQSRAPGVSEEQVKSEVLSAQLDLHKDVAAVECRS